MGEKENMEFRKAAPDDLNGIMEIIKQARNYFRNMVSTSGRIIIRMPK